MLHFMYLLPSADSVCYILNQIYIFQIDTYLFEMVAFCSVFITKDKVLGYVPLMYYIINAIKPI